jgi:AcrR family transcriptional regulator
MRFLFDLIQLLPLFIVQERSDFVVGGIARVPDFAQALFAGDTLVLHKHAGAREHVVMQRRKPDVRVRGTRLGSALGALIQEKSIDDVTVQEVLDRASVGRSTFYLHFSDKHDLLLSQLEKFLETMSTALSLRKEESHRLVPLGERFAHIGGQNKVYRALADSGRLNDFFDLAQGYFARGIE